MPPPRPVAPCRPRRGAALALTVASGLALSLSAGVPGPAQAAAGAAPTFVPCPVESGAVTEVSAARVADSVGVGIHSAYRDTPYADVDRVQEALLDLGIAHVRDDYFLGDLPQRAALQQLGRAGIGLDLIAGIPGDAPAEVYVRDAYAAYPGMVVALEGPNERDVFGGDDWAPRTWERQKDLWQAVQAVEPPPGQERPAVYGPSLAFADPNMEQLRAQGPLGEVSDHANGHVYAGGLPPGARIDDARAILDAAYDDLPVVVTETGYHDALDSSAGHLPVTPAVEATYLARLPLEHLRAGITRSYLYELLDQGPDPRDRRAERSFGLLRQDFTPKPAYLALRRVLRLVEDPTGDVTAPAGPPTRLAVSCTPGVDDVRHLVVPRSDGRTVVFLWRDTLVWDPLARTPVPVRPTPVTLGLPAASPLRVYAPLVSDSALTAVTGSRVRVDLAGDLLAVVLGEGPPREDHARPLPLRRVAPVQQVRVLARPGALVARWRTSGRAAQGVVARSVVVDGERLALAPGRRGRLRIPGLTPGRAVTVEVRALRRDGTSTPVRRTVVPR